MMRRSHESGSDGQDILLISYHFPPSTAVGGQRLASFAKNLPNLGWRVRVLTLKREYIDKIFMQTADLERLDEIQAIRVDRTIKLPTPITLYSAIKSGVRRRFFNSDNNPDQVNRSTASAGSESGKRGLGIGTVLSKIKAVLSLIFEFPDKECRWIIPAVARGVWIVKRRKVAVILTSAPPHSVHLIGLLIHKLTGVRWIADFRDPWSTATVAYSPPLFKFITRIEAALERSVVANAAMVLTTTQRLRDAFAIAYDREPDDKFVWISNGFDGSILSKVENNSKNNVFTITYTGAFYIGRSPEPVFKAVRLLVDNNRIALADVKINLVGHCETVGEESTHRMADKYGLSSRVEILDPVPYLKALEMIKTSHIALLLAPGQPYQIPSKVYDYIGLGTPILALTEEGATADMVRLTRSGEIFDTTQISAIADFIFKTMQPEGDDPQHAGFLNVERFERKTAAIALSKNLQQLTM